MAMAFVGEGEGLGVLRTSKNTIEIVDFGPSKTGKHLEERSHIKVSIEHVGQLLDAIKAEINKAYTPGESIPRVLEDADPQGTGAWYYAVQGRYNGEWETITTEYELANAKDCVREYEDREPDTPLRILKTREA